MASIFGNFRNSLERFLDDRIQSAQAGQTRPAEQVVNEDLNKRAYEEDGEIVRGRKGMIVDPFWGSQFTNGTARQKRGSLSNSILKLAARQDPAVSTIINTRANQVLGFCRKQANHYDIGFVLKPKDETQKVDQEELNEIYDYITNCGNPDNRREQDKISFGQFGYKITADFLRYGYIGVERDFTRDDRLNAFMPLPAETIFYASPNVPKATIEGEVEINDKLAQQMDPGSVPAPQEDAEDDSPIKYVQVVQERTVAEFSAKELIFALFTPDNDIDLNGYAISPLEKAIQMVSNHLKVENHQSMFFTQGMASRGVLVIQGEASPNTLRTLQAQWTQQANGGANAWRTPVIGGVKGVQWVNLQPSNRDMEYAAYQDHILRTIHACFAIDPEETGYGYLSRGTEQRSLAESSNEWKLEGSRDRGLRPLLTRIEEIVNAEILPYANPAWAEKYRFCFAGLDAETRIEETDRLSGEVALHTTLNEARKQASKDPLQVGGNLVLNPLLLQVLQANMTKGMFMEMFLGIPGASQRPDLQYIPDPFYFQWMQFQMMLSQAEAGADTKSGGESDAPGEENDSKDDAEEKVEKNEDTKARMQQAASAFIEANPELFKARQDNLMKSRALHRKVHPIGNAMIRKYREAGNRLVAEVLEAIKQEGVNLDGKQK